MKRISNSRAGPVVLSLFERFEREILNGTHGVEAKYHKSGAVKEILGLGRAELEAIAERLEALDAKTGYDRDSIEDLITAWKLLIRNLARNCNIPEPGLEKGVPEYVAWAHRNAA